MMEMALYLLTFHVMLILMLLLHTSFPLLHCQHKSKQEVHQGTIYKFRQCHIEKQRKIAENRVTKSCNFESCKNRVECGERLSVHQNEYNK